MEKHQFKTTINAPREKVWDILWGDETYPKWTQVFSPPGSGCATAETDWQKGSKVLFIDNSRSGMVSSVHERIDNEFMSFKHLGEVKDGVEKIDENIGWYGAMENYMLKEVDGKTELTVDIDLSADFSDYFQKTFPKALDSVKQLSEA